MVIYFVCSIELGLNSGASLALAEYAKNLAELGNDVTLFAPKYEYEGTIDDVDVVKIPCGSSPYFSKILYQVLLLFVLVKHILVERPDCLLVRHSAVNFSFALPTWFFRIPFILQVVADLTEELKVDSRYVPPAYLVFLGWFERVVFSAAEDIIVIHPALKRHLVNKYGIDSHKVAIVQNGVDTDLFRPLSQTQCQSRLGLDPSFQYLVFVGHIQPWHGVDYIVEAIPHLQQRRADFRVVIVGDGPAMPQIRQIIEELQVADRTILVGEVPRENVPLWLGAADICLLPAKMVRSHPGDPIKMYEYMACGKPILAADVEGYGDFVEANGLGISVDFTDSERLAAAMDSMLRMNLSPYREHNRELAVNNHRWKHSVERVNQVLVECTGYRG